MSRAVSIVLSAVLGCVLGVRLGALDPVRSLEGVPALRYFSPSDYHGHSQVFQVAQDAEGVIYITNLGAVLSFDGERWERIEVPGATFLYGIVALPDDTLAVCGVGQIGLLERDGRGGRVFRSLLPEVPEEDRPAVGEVWDLFSTPQGVFFFSRRLMLRWHEGEMRAWHFETDKMIYGFWTGSTIFIQNLDHGLFRLEGDAIVPVSEEPLFVQPGPRLMVDWDDGAVLVGTMREGLWLLRGGELEAWPTKADGILREGVFNRGVVLPDGRLALGTFTRGVAVLGHDGAFLQLLNEDSGLPQESIVHLGLDRSGGLWCSLGSGVARVDMNGALSYYDRRNGLPAISVTGLREMGDSVYLASGNGLFRLRAVAPPAVPRWERVPGLEGEMHQLIEHDGALFAAVQGRVLRLEGEDVTTVWDDNGLVRALLASPNTPGRIYVGGRNGLGVIREVDGVWQSQGFVPGSEAYVLGILEVDDGTVWVATQRQGVWRIMSEGEGAEWLAQAQIERFGPESGLTPGGAFLIDLYNGEVEASTFDGPFRFNPAEQRFEPIDAVTVAPPLEGWSYDLSQTDAAGETWASVFPVEDSSTDFGLYFGREFEDASGVRQWEWIPSGLFEPIGGVLTLYMEPGPRPVMWVGGWTGLMRWDLAKAPRGVPPVEPRPLVRRVHWDGAIAPSGGADFRPHEVRFEFAAPVLESGVRPEYRTRLRGYEKDWTAWGAASERVFTNLFEGRYDFEVQARTVFGASPETAVWSFRIPPPWYRTLAAYTAYALATGFALWLLVRWRLLRIRRENVRLEALVDRRTADLRESEEGLRRARDEADRANRAKSDFLANMSHELRTPLNGILGYAQVLARDADLSPRNRERVAILEGSGQHLLKLINEVLDLSKIEAERFELKLAPVSVETLVRTLTGMFRPRVDEKGLAFSVVTGPGLGAPVMLDEQKIGQVLFNLLGNAVKFTDAGRVELTIERCAPDRLRFVVADSGPGIPAGRQADVFEPFRQVGEAPAGEQGTGLGLAISKKLVEAMGGAIGLDSAPGAGSRFWFEVPATPAAVAAAPAPDGAGAILGYAGRRRRLLVVDDVAINRNVVRELLEPLGFLVSEADGGEAALASIAAARPDVVLLDMRMAPVDGAETVRRLRAMETGADLPVVAFSASAINFTREDARRLGCDEFVSKPFRLDELLAKLGALLDLEWERQGAGEAPEPAEAFRFAPADLERLRSLAHRGEPAGLKRLLEEILAREPGAEPVVAGLLRLLGRFRMGELGETLDACQPRDT